ncbi:hypothetical protein ABDH81_01600 [Bacillus licheniformis]|nr:hypothetical protein [Bacillus licheniformis]
MKNFIDRWSQTLIEHGRSAFKQQMAKKTSTSRLSETMIPA